MVILDINEKVKIQFYVERRKGDSSPTFANA